MPHFNLIGFIIFGLVAMLTPGPNNYLLFSYGHFYGYKEAYKTMGGIFFGFMAILFITGYGVAELLLKNEAIAFTLKIISSAWLLYLAHSLSKIDIKQPEKLKEKVGFLQMLSLQFVNPKAWIIAIAGAATFMPSYDNNHINVLIYAIGFPLLGIPCMLAWVSIGKGSSNLLKSEKANKYTGITLALLLALSVVLLWIKQ